MAIIVASGENNCLLQSVSTVQRNLMYVTTVKYI